MNKDNCKKSGAAPDGWNRAAALKFVSDFQECVERFEKNDAYVNELAIELVQAKHRLLDAMLAAAPASADQPENYLLAGIEALAEKRQFSIMNWPLTLNPEKRWGIHGQGIGYVSMGATLKQALAAALPPPPTGEEE